MLALQVPKAFWMEAQDLTDKLNTTDLERMFAMDETSPLPTSMVRYNVHYMLSVHSFV